MIQYEIQGKIASAKGTTKQELNITFPEKTDDGYTVAKIEPGSFQEQAKLKKVVIPGSVKVVGGYCFASCPMLKEVVFEEGVEIIEDWAFINCNIDKIVLPSTIKNVGPNAFLGNMCKYDVIDYFAKKNQGKKVRPHSNNKCAVFPHALLEAKENINDEIIESRSKYIDSQLDLVDAGGMTQAQLDIPILFNGDEFMLAYFSKKEAGNVTFEVASESKTQIGLYGDNDPDFFTLKINVISNGVALSHFYIKTPCLEDVKLHNNGVEHVENNGVHYYFYTIRINEKCYGNGNISRAFALNLFDDFVGKYQTELANGLITQDQFDDVKDSVDAKIMEVIEGFISQVDGAPKHTYAMNLLRYAVNDPDIPNKDKIMTFQFERMLKYYNELNSVDSLEHICFVECNEILEFITTATGMSLDDLNAKYGIGLVDATGVPITEEEALSYKNVFMDLETNYNMHAEFMLFIYKELQRLNNQFSIVAFSA